MKNLINVTLKEFNGDELNSVNAREFYTFLGLKKSQFARWSNKHIVNNEYAFENIDFIGFDTNVEGNDVKDYALGIDFAYKIAMKSKGSKAEEIRNMFISLKNEVQNKALMSPSQITESLANTAKNMELYRESLTLQDERLDSQHERIQEVEIQTNSQDDRILHLEQNARLTNQQEFELTQTHHKKVYELAKQYGEDANDKKLISKLHRQVWSIFKKHFMLPRFNELGVSKFDDGIAFLQNIKLKDI